MEQLILDLDNYSLPRDINSYDKIHCQLKHGHRIYWYYEDDLKTFSEMGLNIYECYKDMHSGIVVGKPDVDVRGNELDVEDCVVIMDMYPVEKEYPQFTWLSLKRILDDPDLVDVFDAEQIKGK